MKISTIIIILILLGGAYWYFSGQQKHQINQGIRNDAINQQSSKDYVTLSLSAPTPDETLMKSLELAKEEYQTNKTKYITVLGYINLTGEQEPYVKIEVNDGDFNSAKITDIRTSKFKIMNDLWLYDFLPYDIEINNNVATISLEYSGNISDFRYDLVDVAFNIYEDVQDIDEIEFNFVGKVNFTVNLTRSDIIDTAIKEVSNTNSSTSSGCAKDKQTAYKEYVNAYNAVINAQQSGNDTEVAKAYKVYQEARACYESFLTENSSYSSEEYS